MLTDALRRNHTYLRISITDRCNLRCRYCMPEQGVERVDRTEILRAKEIVLLAQIFVELGIEKIRFTGGEPLIRRGLYAILERFSTIQPRPILAITTNGVLLEGWLERLIAAGVRQMNISLDTLREDRFQKITGIGAWRQVWDGIGAALAHPGVQKVKLNVVVQNGVNDDELFDFALLTLEKPLDVRFIEMMPVNRIPWDKSRLLTMRQMLTQIPDLQPLIPENSSTSGPAKMYKLPGAKGRIGFISPISHPACAVCNRLRLTAQGMLLRCLFDATGLNLQRELRSGTAVDSIAQKIRSFTTFKREIGLAEMRQNFKENQPPCLSAVGG